MEFAGLLILTLLMTVLLGGAGFVSRRSAGNAATEERLRRIEDKLNVLLTHLEIDYAPRVKERWERLAEGNNVSQAIKEYRDAHSVSLAEAKKVVAQYLADARQTT